MWIVAGILLGMVVLTSLIGFHAGPHAHGAAGVLGAAAAGWLVFMALSGSATPGLWALVGADLAVSGGLGVMAWSGLRHRDDHARSGVGHLEGVEGVAVHDLTPTGVVREQGEEWSAVSVNGRVGAGSRVQVLRSGVCLEVWGEGAEPEPGEPTWDLGAERTQQAT